jgi:mitochondrial import inner membrane translocase subunit TIM17
MGAKSAVRSAFVGGFLLAVIEGMGIALSRMASEAQRVAMQQQMAMQQQQAAMAGAGGAGALALPGVGMEAPGAEAAAAGAGGDGGGFFGRLFGGGAQPEPATSSSSAPVDLTHDKYAPPVNPFK